MLLVPVFTSYDPSTCLQISLSLQNRIIGAHSVLEPGMPSCFSLILVSVTGKKAFLKSEISEEASGRRCAAHSAVGHKSERVG